MSNDQGIVVRIVLVWNYICAECEIWVHDIPFRQFLAPSIQSVMHNILNYEYTTHLQFVTAIFEEMDVRFEYMETILDNHVEFVL